jgi:hypothetical protein
MSTTIVISIAFIIIFLCTFGECCILRGNLLEVAGPGSKNDEAVILQTGCHRGMSHLGPQFAEMADIWGPNYQQSTDQCQNPVMLEDVSPRRDHSDSAFRKLPICSLEATFTRKSANNGADTPQTSGAWFLVPCEAVNPIVAGNYPIKDGREDAKATCLTNSFRH